MPNKVILDLDPGGDDSVAFLFAYKCDEIEVEGVTIVVGNETVKQGTENALKILEHIRAKDEVPVAPGCEEPLIRSHIPLKFHGPREWGQ